MTVLNFKREQIRQGLLVILALNGFGNGFLAEQSKHRTHPTEREIVRVQRLKTILANEFES